jgi:hypothetical protein
MNTSGNPGAKAVRFSDTDMVVELLDGRTLSVPLAWFPVLLDAAPSQRANVVIGPFGEGLHWPELDEDISVRGLLAGRPDQTRHRTRTLSA